MSINRITERRELMERIAEKRKLMESIAGRLVAVLALGCAIAGSTAAILEKEWELDPTTWFVAAAVVALLAIFLAVDSGSESS